jgi:hypothetical protein
MLRIDGEVRAVGIGAKVVQTAAMVIVEVGQEDGVEVLQADA